MVKLLCRILVRIFTNFRVQNVPPRTPPEKLIVIGNHQSFLDALMVEGYLPFEITWVVNTGIAAKWYFRIGLRFVPHLAIDTTSPLSIKALVNLIESGKRIAVFPEGRLTMTGSLMKVYDGPAFLAAKTGADVLPLNIDGAVNSYFSRVPPPFPRKLRPKVTMTVFPLDRVPMPEARTGRQRRRMASERVGRILQRTQFHARPRTTLFEAFLGAAALLGKHHRLVEDIRGHEDTYGEVLRASMALGRLVSRLASENEVVGVLMPNANPTLGLLLGMFAMRRIPAMLNYTAGVEGMQSAMETAKAKTLITSRAFLERAKLQEKIPQLRGVRIVYVEDLRAQFGLGDKLWLMLWAVRVPRSVMLPSRTDDPAVILFTSGSEGKPKGVVLSHGAILANIEQVRAVIEFSNKDKFMIALPLFHSFGLTGTLIAVLAGARLFLYPSPLHYRVIPEVIYDRDCTVVFGTSTFLGNYARFAHPYDFYSVRYVVAGAEKLQPEVRKAWMDRFGLRILEGYGATEFAPVISVNTPMAYCEGTVGRLLPEIEHRIERVEGIEEGGLLHVRGPNCMLGYYLAENPGVLKPPSSSVGEGWYNTGDVVEIDEQGFVRIVNRVKRFAKIAGEMISLEVVEKIAAEAVPSKPHAATTAPDGKRGEMIVLFTESGDLKREQLVAAAKKLGQPEIAVARRIERVDKLPRLGSGKFDYMELKQRAANGGGTQADANG